MSATIATDSLQQKQSDYSLLKRIAAYATLALAFGLALYLIIALMAQEQIVLAVLFIVVTAVAAWVVFSPRAYAHRYIYPSIAGMTMFVIFPLIYTVGIGFTNYSANNLLDLERVQNYHLARTFLSEAGNFPFVVYRGESEQLRIDVTVPATGEILTTGLFRPKAGKTKAADEDQVLQLEQVDLEHMAATDEAAKLSIREIIRLKPRLSELILLTREGDSLRLNGLRNFGAVEPVYELLPSGELLDRRSGETLTINYDEGFYQTPEGKLLAPGFTVGVGWANFLAVFTEDSIREPFMQIFAWTVVFSALSILFTLIIGLVLASVLQWDQIKGKPVYRVLLILPYAVPAFISILVFKGLFNQNFGEINLVLENLFGIRPDWFSDPFMAKTMILIVNTWLGFPYMMLLCTGLLQAIPKDLYEASAMDGAGPLSNLRNITFPLVLPPLLPLLIASFAFNFNNFVLIALLTGGAPDIIGASTPAGTTDLLVSYTYRIAFQDSGQNFGLAAAIATVIFLLVGALSLINLRLSKVKV